MSCEPMEDSPCKASAIHRPSMTLIPGRASIIRSRSQGKDLSRVDTYFPDVPTGCAFPEATEAWVRQNVARSREVDTRTLVGHWPAAWPVDAWRPPIIARRNVVQTGNCLRAARPEANP